MMVLWLVCACAYLLAVPIELEIEVPLLAGERRAVLGLDVAREDLLRGLVRAVAQ